MSDDRILQNQLELEKQKREELEMKLEGHLTREKILEEKLEQLKNLVATTQIPNEGNKNQLKDNAEEALTDLPIDQVTSGGGVNGRKSASSSSCSFEILNKQSGQQSQSSEPRFQMSPDTSSRGSETEMKSANQENKRSLESRRIAVQSSILPDSNLRKLPMADKNPDKINFSQEDLKKSEMITTKSDPLLISSWPQNPDTWNGTGARPKNSSHQASNQGVANLDRNPSPGGQVIVSAAEMQNDQNLKMMVSIPREGGTFRINHSPFLNYGQDYSITGISSVFSPEIETAPQAPLSFNGPQKNSGSGTGTDPTQINDLNLGMMSASDKSKSSSTQVGSLNQAHLESLLEGEISELKKKQVIHFPSLSSQSSQSQSPNAKPVFIAQPQPSILMDMSLASQLHGLASELKVKILNEDEVRRIANCAEEAAEIEYKLKMCQSAIQAQEMQNQSQQLKDMEIIKLKEENQYYKRLLQQLKVDIPPLGLDSSWVSVTGNDEETSLKQVEQKSYEDKLQELTVLNNQLFMVNKQWGDSWKLLIQKHEADCKEKDDKVAELMLEIQQLKEELDTNVKEHKEELNSVKLEKYELDQKSTVLDTHLRKEQLSNKVMRAELDRLHRMKGNVEKHSKNSYQELETENVVLKQQLTVTMDDFHKEKKDKLRMEEKLKRLMSDKSEMKKSLEGKVRTANFMLTKREEQLVTKDKKIEEIQRTMDDLKAKLHAAQRRTVILDDQSHYTIPSGNADLFYPSVSPAYNPNQLKLLQKQSELETNALGQPSPPEGEENPKHAASAEHMPDAWTCSICTFINFPLETYCAMCHAAKSSYTSLPYSFTSPHSLTSRDQWPGKNEPDSELETDGK